ncbi:2-dehydro-3-deoxygalactonokinase [Aurantiacibacter suaedae]|uniref:2-dehydro-3-deoxygalactonokinase n=1 Tax=Aurantiacibacter suaedae TaxID=2545755 RepID=UPI0013871C53|nr:2-dehydro-3-deoxygalactonokinase [Aurantiacibacter suaedae]
MVSQLIAGLWGTTQLQLFRIVDGRLADTRKGPGVAQVIGQDFEALLLRLVEDWLERDCDTEVLLAGMVGSTIGWRETEYVRCPAPALKVMDRTASVSLGHRRAQILSGMACINSLGEPDVLRGEEVELIGLEAMLSQSGADRSLVCIPGTHTKWVMLKDSLVESFQSSVAGEIFAALTKSGVLAADHGDTFFRDVFVAAVGDAARDAAALVHLLFSARSRVTSGKMDASHAADRLSGLLIGADVAGVLRSFALSPGNLPEVAVVAMPAIGKRYVVALEEFGFNARLVPSQDAAVAGFLKVSESIGKGVADA